MATIAMLLHHERSEAQTLALETVDWLAARDHEVRLPTYDAALIERPDARRRRERGARRLRPRR